MTHPHQLAGFGPLPPSPTLSTTACIGPVCVTSTGPSQTANVVEAVAGAALFAASVYGVAKVAPDVMKMVGKLFGPVPHRRAR